MEQFSRLLKRFFLTTLAAFLILVAVNVLLYAFFVLEVVNNSLVPSVSDTMQSVSDSLTEADGQYELSEQGEELLAKVGAWAMLLNNETGDVLWNDALPGEIPLHYTASDIAKFSRGYLEDYPVFVWENPNGLLVVGYPKDTYTKILSNYSPLILYRLLPAYFGVMLVCNLLVLFLFYYFLQKRTLRAMNPLLDAISTLAEGKAVSVTEQEPFAELAKKINQVSQQLRKRDTARANWITGVSHDIRTPLSVILGDAELLSQEKLPPEAQRKISRISAHGLRIRDLVSDLNLASKLDYQMQPLRMEQVAVAPLLRKLAVDFLNRGYEDKYEISCETDHLPAGQCVESDRALLSRALENLISNSIVHNPEGCKITLSAGRNGDHVQIIVSDNGCGVTEEQLNALRAQPHYMLSDDSTHEPRHGLGLLIVSQIAQAHGGQMQIGKSKTGGFETVLSLPIQQKKA